MVSRPGRARCGSQLSPATPLFARLYISRAAQLTDPIGCGPKVGAARLLSPSREGCMDNSNGPLARVTRQEDIEGSDWVLTIRIFVDESVSPKIQDDLYNRCRLLVNSVIHDLGLS